MTAGDPAAQCVDLRAKFGHEYRVEFEASYHAEKPEHRGGAAAWLRLIPCRFGHIYPFGGSALAAWTDSPSRRRMLMTLPCCTVHQDGDTETTVLFDVADFKQVGAIMQPRRRRRLSAEQRAASIERLAAYHFRPSAAARQNELGGQEREETSRGEAKHVQLAEVA